MTMIAYFIGLTEAVNEPAISSDVTGLGYGQDGLTGGQAYKTTGMSVRCMQDY